MLRVILITIVVLLALRFFARLTAPRRTATPGAQPVRDVRGRERKPQRPALSAAERERLEDERERALREGRQIDAIEIHRRLTGLGQNDATEAADAPRGGERAH
jgi:hypothetical protein